MPWTREALMDAARKSYPHLKECFIAPMVDLYLAKPDVFAEIVKKDMKREAKAKKAPVEPKQSLYESAVRVGRAENSEPPAEKCSGVVVDPVLQRVTEVDAEATESVA